MPTLTFDSSSGMVSSDDGYIDANSATYPPSSPTAPNMTDTRVGISRGSYGNFFITVGLVRWNTAALPDDAVIQSATVRGYITRLENANTRNLTADYYAWTGVTGDWSQTAQTGAISTPLSSLTLNTDNDIALINPDANISRSGNTSLRLHIDGGQPTNVGGLSNSVDFVSIDHTTLTEMRLIVTFTAPGPQPRQLSSATSSGTGTSVTINKQSGTATGDMMNATVAFQGGSGVTVTATGWTLVDRRDSTTDISVATYSKTAGASESAETWTLSGSQRWDSACESYCIDSGATPILDLVSGQANASSTSIAAPSITTANNDELLKYVGAINAGQAGGIAPDANMSELADVQTGTLFGGTIAAKTYYFLDAAATSGGDLMDMQDGGSAPATATMSTTGWTVGNNTAPNYADMDRAAIVARTASDATFGWKTTAPTSSVDSTRGNAGRIPVALNGSFASANWTYSWVPRLSSANTAQRVSLRFRLFRGTSATGSGATEITAGAAEAGPMTAAASSASTTAYTVTVNPGALTLVNEYLFFVLCCRITTAGGATTSNILLTKDTNFQVATSTFTPTADIALEASQEYRVTAGATSTRTAVAGTNAAVNVASLMALAAPAVIPDIYHSHSLDYFY